MGARGLAVVEFISLPDAWHRFVRARHGELLDPERWKPPAPGGSFDLVLDRKTGRFVREMKLGAEYDEFIDWYFVSTAESNFRENVALSCCALLTDDEGAEFRQVNFEDWWWACAGDRSLWRVIEMYGPARCDGGSRSWPALETATSFPIAIHFERETFEALDVVKGWSEPARPASPMADRDLQAWLRAEAEKLGGRPPIRTWRSHQGFFEERGITKLRFESVWGEMYPDARPGRPSKNAPRNVSRVSTANRTVGKPAK